MKPNKKTLQELLELFQWAQVNDPDGDCELGLRVIHHAYSDWSKGEISEDSARSQIGLHLNLTTGHLRESALDESRAKSDQLERLLREFR